MPCKKSTMNKGVGWLLLAIAAGVGLSCDGPVSEQHIGTVPAALREHAIERTQVRSSALRSVGYDEDSQTLEIEFTNGAVYQYFDVPPEVHHGLMAAESLPSPPHACASAV